MAMQFVDYYDTRDKDLQDWYVAVVEQPNAQLLSEHVQWLQQQGSSGKFFLQPMAAAFWFEHEGDAFLYFLMFGEAVRLPVRHDPAGIRRAMRT